MAFCEQEIHASREEDTGRGELRNRYRRAGLEYSDAVRQSIFNKVSLRNAPVFVNSDEHLRLVVAQTAFSHFRIGPWKQVPGDLIMDPVGLMTLTAMRFEAVSKVQPHFQTLFNETRDYVAVLSAFVYLYYRMKWKIRDIAKELNVGIQVLNDMGTRFRYNAARLGFEVPRTRQFRGLKKLLTPQERSDVMKKALSGAEYRQRRSAIAKVTNARPEVKEKQRAAMKAVQLQKFLKTVAWG